MPLGGVVRRLHLRCGVAHKTNLHLALFITNCFSYFIYNPNSFVLPIFLPSFVVLSALWSTHFFYFPQIISVKVPFYIQISRVATGYTPCVSLCLGDYSHISSSGGASWPGWISDHFCAFLVSAFDPFFANLQTAFLWPAIPHR